MDEELEDINTDTETNSTSGGKFEDIMAVTVTDEELVELILQHG